MAKKRCLDKVKDTRKEIVVQRKKLDNIINKALSNIKKELQDPPRAKPKPKPDPKPNPKPDPTALRIMPAPRAKTEAERRKIGVAARRLAARKAQENDELADQIGMAQAKKQEEKEFRKREKEKKKRK